MLTQSFLSRLLSLSKSSRLVFALTVGFFGKTALIQADFPLVGKLKPSEIKAIAGFTQASDPTLVRKDKDFYSADVFNFQNVKVVPKAYGPPDIPPIRA